MYKTNIVLLKIQSYFSLFRIALQGTERNFTSGSVRRAMFMLALPSMLELSMESLFVLVDLLFVSSLGEMAITIVGVTNAVLILMQSVATGLSIAATALISRRIGEKLRAEAGAAAMQVIYVGLCTGILCSAGCLLFYKPILQFSGANASLIHFGGNFSRLMFAAACLVIMRILLNGIFRGSGDASRAMKALMLANLLNILFCSLFIFGAGPFPAMGITGAAIAMICSNLITLCYQFWHLFKTQRMQIGKEQMRLNTQLIGRLVKLASAGTVQHLVPSSSRFIMIAIVAKLGESVLAGYILANRVIMFTVLPAWGIANAAGVLTGQNLGARQPERAEESVWKTGRLNMLFLGAVAILLFASSRSLASVFSNVPEVLDNASGYLKYMAIAYFFFGYTMVICRAMNAAGAVNTVTALNVFMFFIIQLPLAYLLAINANWGPEGIFTAIMASEIVLAFSCVLIFKKGKWKHVKL